MGKDDPHIEANSKLIFPTSFAQQRLWFLEQLQPGTTSYIVAWSLRIHGPLNIPALHNALNEIIRRHEILRTTFEWKDGMPVQVVADSFTLPLPLVDLSSFGDARARAEYLGREEAHTPVNLETGPLVRAQLLKVSGEEHVLLFTMHHIIFDGWSRRLFIRELSAFYESFCSGTQASLPQPKLQYGDYAVWQRKHLQGATFEKQLSYWREQLAGVPGSLDLPVDHPRPAMQTFNGAKVPIHLSRELTAKLAEVGRQCGATPFMTLLAAFQVLLSRHSHQPDVVVGSPIANRNRAELEDIIGFFANTLVLRTRISDDASFADVLAQVKETALGAYAHQDIPFERLVEELRPDRNLSQNPLFQVLFSLQNAPRQAFELAGLRVELMDVAETTAKFDIAVFLSEGADGIQGRFEYNTDLFDTGTIERMIGRYQVLLQAASENPQAKISQLPILTGEERQRVLSEWNATSAEYPRDLSVHDAVERQAQRTPLSIAITCGNEQINYSDLNRRANRLARYLQARGVGPETPVGIFLDRSIDLVVSLLAVLKAGGTYVPLDPAYPAERIGFILQDAGVHALLTEKSLLPLLPPTVANAIDVHRIAPELSRESDQPLTGGASSPESLAYILYTSGSTGKPKGVQVTHANLTNFLCSMQREPGLAAEDTLLAVTTLCFDIAGLEIYLPLVTGARLVLASRNEAADGARLLKLMKQTKATVMQATPATWRMLIEAGWQGSRKLRILCGGEALPGDLASQLLPRCAELFNMYGPTETTIWSSVYRVSSASATCPIGRPIANTTFYILDSHMQPVPVGVPGELFIGGDGVARGYFNRPELTAEKFVSDPFAGIAGARMYRTGDLAKYQPDGNVQYLGRTDFQVKVRGFRIELGEIETALVKHPAIQQAVVAAREDVPGDKRLVAYVVPASGQHVTVSDLRNHLKQTLPDYMLPTAAVELEKLPLTPNGKVDRKALPKPEVPAATSATAVPPRDEIEDGLLKVWKEILQTPAIGVTDNFFDLGGHSLLAVRLVNEIKKRMGVDIPLTSLFQGATVEHLARIFRGTTVIQKAVAHRIQAGGTKPPFFAAVLAGVNALGYVPLAKHLGADQPFYTLQSPGPGPKATGRPYTPAEYEVVADEYVRAMRSVQPKGPYRIGGTCEGARIAFEMTRILESQGETVELLAIIDTWVLENTQNKRLWKLYYYYTYLLKLWRQPWNRKAGMVMKAARNRVLWSTGSSAAPKKSEWIDTYWPGKTFTAPRVQSRITVFKIARQPFYYKRDPLLGWGDRTMTGVDTRVIPNGRHLFLLREPYVRALSAALLEVLGQTEPETTTSHSSSSKGVDSTQVVSLTQ